MKWIGLTILALLITLSHARPGHEGHNHEGHNHKGHNHDNGKKEDHEICNDVSVVGWNSAARTSFETSGWSVIFSGKPLPCDGEVSQWMYWAKVSEPLRAVVWRPTNVDTVYTVVGINDIPAGVTNEAVVYTVPKDQRIEVHQGDIIGVSFSDASPQITWVDDSSDAAQVRWYPDSDPSDLSVGDEAITTGVADGAWSFSAIVTEAGHDHDRHSHEPKDVHDVLAQGKALLEFLTNYPDLE